MIKVSKTKLEGVLLIQPEPFEDFRGEYVETFNKKAYSEAIISNLKGTIYEKEAHDIDFVEDDISTGHKGVIKGMHGDTKTWKLIQCLFGKFYEVVLNYNRDSKDYGKWEAFTLSDKNRIQVLIPPMYGNGHLVLSQFDIYHYKQSQYYGSDKQFTVKWNDPEFKIKWPIKNPILSVRDETGGQ